MAEPAGEARSGAGEGSGNPLTAARRVVLREKGGLLARQQIRDLVVRGKVRAAEDIGEVQLQPASLDLRLGTSAYRVRASFLPGRGRTVAAQLEALKYDRIDLRDGAVLERGCVYVVELQEILDLPDSISAFANPKSSTGRIDVFTRLITDESDVFDRVRGGYAGPLYAEISPRSFSIRVRKGSRLGQLRFRARGARQAEHRDVRISDRELETRHARQPLVDGEALIRAGLVVRINLADADGAAPIGYRAQRFTDVIDIDAVGQYAVGDFWEPIAARPDHRLILDPDQFYILASRERLHIPDDLAAEMVPIDPTMGEFRVHYAGFFDPGFGWTAEGRPGSRAVLEVRSHEVPFVLEHGQIVGRLEFEELPVTPDLLYGAGGTSNYQGQGLKLSKHFRAA
jgi:dCTP deaminase